MGKWTDKNYITRSEWAYGFGGGVNAMKNKQKQQKYQKASFNLCSLTLAPFTVPVCDLDGVVYDLENILPFIQKYARNPFTGKEMKTCELVKLVYHKNKIGEYYCPVTLKTFTDYSHIVTNKKTGNVYSFEAHTSINPPGSKMLRDPITDDLIQPTDLITLQDPNSPKKIDTTTAANREEIFIPPEYPTSCSVTSTSFPVKSLQPKKEQPVSKNSIKGKSVQKSSTPSQQFSKGNQKNHMLHAYGDLPSAFDYY